MQGYLNAEWLARMENGAVFAMILCSILRQSDNGSKPANEQ